MQLCIKCQHEHSRNQPLMMWGEHNCLLTNLNSRVVQWPLFPVWFSQCGDEEGHIWFAGCIRFPKHLSSSLIFKLFSLETFIFSSRWLAFSLSPTWLYCVLKCQWLYLPLEHLSLSLCNLHLGGGVPFHFATALHGWGSELTNNQLGATQGGHSLCVWAWRLTL